MVHGRPHWGKAPEEGTGSSRRAEAAGRKEREWVLPLASGILLVAAYPPVDAGWLAWIALVPVSWAALRAGSGPGVGRGRRLLAASFAAGMLWGGGIFHPLLWIQEGTAAERVGGTAVIALLTGTIAALYAAAVSPWAAVSRARTAVVDPAARGVGVGLRRVPGAGGGRGLLLVPGGDPVAQPRDAGPRPPTAGCTASAG